MQIEVLLFAGLKDRAGVSRLSVEVPDGATVSDAITAAGTATPTNWDVPTAIMCAVNEEYQERDFVLSDGDELALIPPVSGGMGAERNEYVEVTGEPLDSMAIAEHVRADSDGAIVIFEGVTRDHNDGRHVEYLEYEAYQPMAENKIRELFGEMRARYEIDRTAVAHRVGRVDIGEKSMVVAVSAAHRRPAFEAALYFVDRLKEVVPIWKKEYFEGGEVWINDTPG
ncbi:MAG: molybdenum cofactor biosynthesis protein MoaE [Chloroflexi bacterium]|nr:molybdenum cofactor biosynthesis protein MoaE [Chloroflexota bacterium]